jgi:hypothetical protein
MKCLAALRAGMLVAGLTVWLGSARADVITFEVSATMLPVTGVGADASCAASGCALSGTVTINNTTGAIISEDVTFAGESPTLRPFTENFVIGRDGASTVVVIDDSNGARLDLVVDAPVQGSLVGYTGGLLDGDTRVIAGCHSKWVLGAGSLTETPTAVAESDHELAPLLLLASGLAVAFRKRLLPN